MSEPRKIELLAPARNAQVAIDAINHGADAVYIGPESFGARAAAGNSCADIARVAEYAHRFNARVYATVNTIIYESELMAVERLIAELYRAGVDALIVQDMAVLQLDIPPIELHASTQCDIRTPEKARFLQDVGFSQLVLPRELTFEEIASMHRAVTVPLEVFVHGALCVSYSGDCQASLMTTGRSANRGECSQVCRLPFDLIDGDGRMVVRGKHLLSLRDLNLSGRLADLLAAGASSLKIEGRLKDSDYVKNTVAYYRRALDRVIEASPERYVRSSAGDSTPGFTPDPARSFNRGFTTYFTAGARHTTKMAGFDTPKSVGQPVGKVIKVDHNVITARLETELHNGDGLGFFDGKGFFSGFRLNRVDGQRLYAATPVSPAPGTVLYRNADRLFAEQVARSAPSRRMPVDFVLRRTGWGVALDVTDRQRGVSATATMALDELPPSRTPQTGSRRDVLSRLGGTDYVLGGVDDRLGDVFMAASQLTALRRQALDALDCSAACVRRRPLRKAADEGARVPESVMSRHDNVANSLARGFYVSHGATTIEPATETAVQKGKETVVMTTRYCLRREMGACLRTHGGATLKGPLTLVHGNDRFRLDFDCRDCRMKVLTFAR